MKKVWLLKIAIVCSFSLSACAPSVPTLPPPSSSVSTNTAKMISAANPCTGAHAPAQWHHVIVLMFENKTYDKVIGPAPYITRLANKCATATDWKDADTKVDGSLDGKHDSKPNYATLTSGVSPSVHGLINDKYDATTSVDNIYNQLNLAGKSFKDYYEGQAGGCNVRFNGDYHDPMRYLLYGRRCHL